MLIAFIGSHGTGKTTTCQSVANHQSHHWQVFEDYYRKSASRLGCYPKTRSDVLKQPPAVRQTSSAALTGAAFGALLQWIESMNQENRGLIDMGPPSQISYHQYWMATCKTPASAFLFQIAQHISSKINLFIYLPINTIPLVEDDIRSNDPVFQKEIDQRIHANLADLGIPNEKVFTPKSSTLEGRIDEILHQIHARS